MSWAVEDVVRALRETDETERIQAKSGLGDVAAETVSAFSNLRGRWSEDGRPFEPDERPALDLESSNLSFQPLDLGSESLDLPSDPLDLVFESLDLRSRSAGRDGSPPPVPPGLQARLRSLPRRASKAEVEALVVELCRLGWWEPVALARAMARSRTYLLQVRYPAKHDPRQAYRAVGGEE